MHPLYDNFGEAIQKEVARKKLDYPYRIKSFYFWIHPKIKGLDLLLKAMNDVRIRESNIRLLVAGEFYENRKEYDELIAELGISSQLILRTGFIRDSEVGYYLSAADFV